MKRLSATAMLATGHFISCPHTHAHPFNGPFSKTIQVSQYRKVKPVWILLKQETVSGSGISWAICRSATCSRQITMPIPLHSIFYRPDVLPATEPTASERWRQSLSCPYIRVYLLAVTWQADGWHSVLMEMRPFVTSTLTSCLISLGTEWVL